MQLLTHQGLVYHHFSGLYKRLSGVRLRSICVCHRDADVLHTVEKVSTRNERFSTSINTDR